MDVDQYCLLVGRVVVNFQLLELALRAYLYAKKHPPHTDLAPGQTLDSLRVGETVPENAMTNYNTLGELIKRYNGVVEGDHPELQVDLSVVKVRDAFGHGRSASLDQTKPNFLLKFDKPTKGIARVDFIEQLTPEWLDSQAKRVAQEAKKVVNALNMLGLA